MFPWLSPHRITWWFNNLTRMPIYIYSMINTHVRDRYSFSLCLVTESHYWFRCGFDCSGFAPYAVLSLYLPKQRQFDYPCILCPYDGDQVVWRTGPVGLGVGDQDGLAKYVGTDQRWLEQQMPDRIMWRYKYKIR